MWKVKVEIVEAPFGIPASQKHESQQITALFQGFWGHPSAKHPDHGSLSKATKPSLEALNSSPKPLTPAHRS